MNNTEEMMFMHFTQKIKTAVLLKNELREIPQAPLRGDTILQLSRHILIATHFLRLYWKLPIVLPYLMKKFLLNPLLVIQQIWFWNNIKKRINEMQMGV